MPGRTRQCSPTSSSAASTLKLRGLSDMWKWTISGRSRANSETKRLLRRVVMCALVSLQALSSLRAAGQSAVEEYRLKAAFLFHFAQFVEWPSNSRSEERRVG